MVHGGQRKKSVIFVVVLGIGLMAVTVALNITWVLANLRSTLLLVFGIFCFAIVIAGLALNTIFLVREIRRNEQHDAFINAVTHELKTPVASIRLYLQTLQQREVGREKELEFLETMVSDADRLQTTIDQVLLAGKTASSRRLLSRTDVDLPELVRDCLSLAGRRHHLPSEALELNGQLDEAVVSGDSDELRAAIMNLIDNAVKYSGERVKIIVSIVQVSAKKVAVQVRDQGIGITSDELRRVFRRFYRIPGRFASAVKGTGLGLAIVLAVAKRHGGRAYVESDGAGKGSTFTLELPLKSA